MRNRHVHLARPALILGGFLLLGVLISQLGPERILSLLSSLGGNFLVLVLLFGAHESIRTLAVRSCLPVDGRPPFPELLRIRLLGEAAGVLTCAGPLAAETTRTWLLAGRQRSMHGYSAALGELMANGAMSAGVNVVVTGYVLLAGHVTGPGRILAHVLCWGSLTFLGAVAGSVFSRAGFFAPLARVAGALPVVGRRMRSKEDKMGELDRTIRAVLVEQPRTLARILLLETAAQMLLVGEVYWAIRSMGIPVFWHSGPFIEVMTRAVSVIEFVGVTEVGYAAVFGWLGLPAAVGFTLCVVKTLRSLATAGVGLGVLVAASQLKLALDVVRRPREAAIDSGT